MTPHHLAPVGVLGAGFLGAPLAESLAPRPVIATTRSGHSRAGHPHITSKPLDLLDATPAQIAQIFADTRALVLSYAAGPHQDRRLIYLEGARRALEAAQTLDLERLIYTSSTSALPDHEGYLDETCTQRPLGERGLIQREAEDLVIDACERHKIPWFVLRLAGLYGPGRGLGRIYRHDPERPLAGDGMQATNLIHRDDAITAIRAALAAPAHVSALVHVCDDDHRPRRAIFAQLAAAEGLPEPSWQHPPAALEPTGKRVDNTRMKQLLGVELRYPQHTLAP
jgi:nucleoside-diphosphate-sugar epimerase